MKPASGEFIYLSQEDVIRCNVLDMSKAIVRIEEAFSLFEKGECIHPPKSVLRWSEDPNVEYTKGRINFLSAYIGGDIHSVGMKWIGSFPMNRERHKLPRATAMIILNDPDTGIPISLMEGSVISAVRTGAVTGVAVKHLARPSTSVIGIVGTGVQSRTQLLALASVLKNLQEVKVFNRTRERAIQFVEEMEPKVGVRIGIVKTPEEAVRESDLAIVATTIHEPLIKGEWLSPGMMSIQFSGYECDFEVIRRADKIVCDEWEGLKHRGIMTPAIMYSQGLLKDEDIYADLGEIVNGKKKGRESDNERIHFAPMGMGISDVAIASLVYEIALKEGIGTRLSLWKSPLWT